MQSTTNSQPLRIISHKVEFYREHIIDVPSNLACVGCKRARMHVCVATTIHFFPLWYFSIVILGKIRPCDVQYRSYVYIALRWKEKYIVSWVELIFIVKHNNIHLLLPHLLHVDSITKLAEVHRAILTLKSSIPKKTKMILSCPFIFHLLIRFIRVVRKIVRYFAFYLRFEKARSGSRSWCFDKSNECDNRRPTA